MNRKKKGIASRKKLALRTWVNLQHWNLEANRGGYLAIPSTVCPPTPTRKAGDQRGETTCLIVEP